MNGSTWLRIGAISAALAVAAGAFGAHGLRGRVTSGKLDAHWLDVFQTGAQYQMYHALALVAVGLLMFTSRPGMAVSVAGWSFLAGTILFSGSLYALALTQIKVLGAITPFGGLAFIVGWIALAIGAGARS